MPGGESILYHRFEPDARGFLHPDLFLWTPDTGTVRRLTHLADVRHADPAPDGTWAVAVRSRNGYSQLVRVDLRCETAAAGQTVAAAWRPGSRLPHRAHARTQAPTAHR